MANRNSSKELYIYIRICAELQKYITLQYEFVCFGCLLCSTEFATTFDRVTLNDTSNSFENWATIHRIFSAVACATILISGTTD